MAVSLHHEDREEAVGLSQAGIQHLDEDGLELTVVDCKLLVSLEEGEILLVDSIK